LERIELADGQVIIGDALEVMKQMEASSVDLIVVDPPYNVLEGFDLDNVRWDVFSTLADYVKFTEAWIQECFRVLKPGRQMYVFWSQKYLPLFFKLRNPFTLKKILVWHRPNLVRKFTSRTWVYTYDFIFYLSKGEHVKVFNASFLKRENVDVIQCALPQSNFKGLDRRVHPTQKPVELIKLFIKISSNPGEVVMDPFAGSGTTGVAARLMNRRFILIEKDSKWKDVILARLNEANLGMRLEDF